MQSKNKGKREVFAKPLIINNLQALQLLTLLNFMLT